VLVSDSGEKALNGVKKEEVEKEEVRIKDTYKTKEDPAEQASHLETQDDEKVVEESKGTEHSSWRSNEARFKTRR